MVRILELFAGTGSVGKVAKELGYDVLSVDIDGNSDLTVDILEWDYKTYPTGYFDLIWSSFDCTTFSNVRRCWIGRKNSKFGNQIITKELLEKDEINNGLPLIRKTEEIINYFKPKYYFMENPAHGTAKKYIDKPSYRVDYCAYGFKYKKPTLIWTNKKDWIPKKCNCKKHIDFQNQGNSKNKAPRYVIPEKLIYDLIHLI